MTFDGLSLLSVLLVAFSACVLYRAAWGRGWRHGVSSGLRLQKFMARSCDRCLSSLAHLTEAHAGLDQEGEET